MQKVYSFIYYEYIILQRQAGVGALLEKVHVKYNLPFDNNISSEILQRQAY